MYPSNRWRDNRMSRGGTDSPAAGLPPCPGRIGGRRPARAADPASRMVTRPSGGTPQLVESGRARRDTSASPRHSPLPSRPAEAHEPLISPPRNARCGLQPRPPASHSRASAGLMPSTWLRSVVARAGGSGGCLVRAAPRVNRWSRPEVDPWVRVRHNLAVASITVLGARSRGHASCCGRASARTYRSPRILPPCS